MLSPIKSTNVPKCPETSGNVLVCSHGLRHPAIRISFAYGTKEIVLVHEPANFLGLHNDSHVQQPHIDAAHAFLVAPEIVGFQDQGKIRPVLFLPFFPLP